eukprot:360507-Chlamydomonas_euryale.AAC.1
MAMMQRRQREGKGGHWYRDKVRAEEGIGMETRERRAAACSRPSKQGVQHRRGSGTGVGAVSIGWVVAGSHTTTRALVV